MIVLLFSQMVMQYLLGIMMHESDSFDLLDKEMCGQVIFNQYT